MNITIEQFNRLNDIEKEFVLKYGADNCSLVKFEKTTFRTLCDYYGKETYNEDDIALIKSITDNKWHIVYCYEDGEYYLCGNDDLVFPDACIVRETDDIRVYLKQQK